MNRRNRLRRASSPAGVQERLDRRIAGWEKITVEIRKGFRKPGSRNPRKLARACLPPNGKENQQVDTTEQIAAEMLRLLSSPQRWAKGDLATGFSRYCLYGARGRIARLNLDLFTTGQVAEFFTHDPYMERLVRVIREQYPEYERLAEDQAVIISFNDGECTRYADIRLVLEKAAAG